MASPFYIPTQDMFGNEQRARQMARQQYAGQLAALFAGGDTQAGKGLAAVDPRMAQDVQSTLERMPGTAQSNLAKGNELLKKWHVAISNEPNADQAALMYNQMLAQAAQSGVDTSSLAQTYSPQAVQSQLMELASFDELVAQQKEQRLADSGGGSSLDERNLEHLLTLEPVTAKWQEIFLKRYEPLIIRTPSGDFLMPRPIPAEIAAKAQQGGIVIPETWGVTTPTLPPGRLPGEIVTGANAVTATHMATKPVRIGGTGRSQEEIALAKEDRDIARQEQKDAVAIDRKVNRATVLYRGVLSKMDELAGLIRTMGPGDRLFSDKLKRARAIVGRLMVDIKSPEIADLGAITASDAGLMAGMLPTLEGMAADRFVPSQAMESLTQGKQFLLDKADAFYAGNDRKNPLPTSASFAAPANRGGGTAPSAQDEWGNL